MGEEGEFSLHSFWGLLQTSFQSHHQLRPTQPSSLTLASLIDSSCPDPPGECMLVWSAQASHRGCYRACEGIREVAVRSERDRCMRESKFSKRQTFQKREAGTQPFGAKAEIEWEGSCQGSLARMTAQELQGGEGGSTW